MVNCCVPNCNSGRKRKSKYIMEGGEYVSYHEFPSNLTLRVKWLDAINRKDFVVNDTSNSTRVCSKHFKSDDFNTHMTRRILKPGSVPSVFDGNPTWKRTSTSFSGHSEPIVIKVEPSEMMEVQETSAEPELIVGIKTRSIPSVSNGNPTHMQASTASSELPEPKIRKLEPAEIRMVKPHGPDMRVNEETAETSIDSKLVSLKRELRMKEHALQEKSKLLDIRIREVRKLKRQLKNRTMKLEKVPEQIGGLERDLNYYTNSIHHTNLKKLLEMETSGCIEPKHILLLTQLKFMFSKKFRWPEIVLKECDLLQAVYPSGYKMLIERDLVNLPSRSTLQRYITGNTSKKSSPAAKLNHSNTIMGCHHRILIALY